MSTDDIRKKKKIIKIPCPYLTGTDLASHALSNMRVCLSASEPMCRQIYSCVCFYLFDTMCTVEFSPLRMRVDMRALSDTRVVWRRTE